MDEATAGAGSLAERSRSQWWLTCACDDGQPPARGPAGVRPLRDHRVHDRHPRGPADHLAGDPVLRPRRPLHRRDHGARVSEESERRARNPKVALLFSDPTGSGAPDAPQVLVQGIAEVDDRDLAANRERYARESVEKLPATADQLPPKPLRRMFGWYFTRIYVHVRPERVYVWHAGDASLEPELFDAYMEEVRSGHHEDAERGARAVPWAALRRGTSAWTSSGSGIPGRSCRSCPRTDFPSPCAFPSRWTGTARRIRLGGAPVRRPLAARASPA